MQTFCNANCALGGHGFWCLVYDFQTLIAGAIAVIVALLALIPVWCQLRDSNLQARMSRRETLATMLRAGLRRHAEVEESIARPLNAAVRATSDPVGEPQAIDTEAAFYLEQELSHILDWYLVVLADTESPEIEARKGVLKSTLDALVETLGQAIGPITMTSSRMRITFRKRNGKKLSHAAQGQRSKPPKRSSV